MTNPTDDEILKFLEEHGMLHGPGNRDFLIGLYRAIAAAEQEACAEVFERMQANGIAWISTVAASAAIRAGHVCGWNGATPASDVCPVCEAEAIRERSET